MGMPRHFSAKKSREQMGEERRKFYVVLTRARHRIFLAYSGFYSWPSGDINRPGPSRFLEELHLIDDTDHSDDW